MGKTLHVVSILDRSGSMSGNANEVIGAYNSFIKDQQKLAKEKDIDIKTTLVLFDDKIESIYEKVPVAQTPELNSEVYYARGMTALLDAVGTTVQRFNKKKNVIVFIETDGHENASREFTGDKLKQLVQDKKDDGWDFNFVGADLDAVTTTFIGKSLGINAGKTMAFNKTTEGYATRNASFSVTTSAYIDSNMKTK